MNSTSVMARDQHERSGKRKSNSEAVYKLVVAMPGCTAVELYHMQHQLGYAMERHEISKRLPEVRGHGLIHNGDRRERRFNKNLQSTWWPGPKPTTQGELNFGEVE